MSSISPSLPLQLIVTGQKGLEQPHAGLQPRLQVLLHGISFHSLQSLQLSLLFGLGLGLEFVQVFLGFIVASGTIQSAQRGIAGFHDVVHHVVLAGSQLGTHGLVRLLLVRSTLRAGILVEIPDRGPTAGTRAVAASDGCFAQVDVRKANVLVPRKRLDGFVPSRRLLSSSASSRRGDPADHEGLVRGDRLVDEGGELVLRFDLGRVIEVAIGVNGMGGAQNS